MGVRHHNQPSQVGSAEKQEPVLIPGMIGVEGCKRKWIPECCRRLLECHPVLREVASGLLGIPLKQHLGLTADWFS